MCHFVMVSEVWTEAEALEVRTFQARDSIFGSKSGWRWAHQEVAFKRQVQLAHQLG